MIALTASPGGANPQGVSRVPGIGVQQPDSASLESARHYDPEHAALGWTSSGQGLLVAHREQYSSGDVRWGGCTETGIFIVPIEGGESQLVAHGPAVCAALRSHAGVSLHPARDRISYLAHPPVNERLLFAVHLSTGQLTALPAPCDKPWEVLEPAVWSPRGDRMVVVSGCDHPAGYSALFLMSADGTAVHRLAPPNDWTEADPAWKPDGDWLAFTQVRDTPGGTSDSIAVMDTLGGGRRVLAAGWGPAWSPDGQWIAFFREQRIGEHDGTYTIRVVRPNGRDQREVFRTSERSTMSRGWGAFLEGQPRGPLLWSPDSRWLLFGRTFDTGTTIWRLHLEDGHVDQVTVRREPAPLRSREDGA
jgi:hypothetical protein